MSRTLEPLFAAPNPSPPTRARQLHFSKCDPKYAASLNRKWHSRLPRCQDGPWQFAFHAHFDGVTFAVALWHNPSTRSLPCHWLELRRMACAPDAPRYTASRFLGWMVRHFKREHPERERCISYQDPAVHSGTIYRASGWVETYHGVNRKRDRSGKRTGTDRLYRWNDNGDGVDAVGKIRWEKALSPDRGTP